MPNPNPWISIASKLTNLSLDCCSPPLCDQILRWLWSSARENGPLLHASPDLKCPNSKGQAAFHPLCFEGWAYFPISTSAGKAGGTAKVNWQGGRVRACDSWQTHFERNFNTNKYTLASKDTSSRGLGFFVSRTLHILQMRKHCQEGGSPAIQGTWLGRSRSAQMRICMLICWTNLRMCDNLRTAQSADCCLKRAGIPLALRNLCFWVGGGQEQGRGRTFGEEVWTAEEGPREEMIMTVVWITED